MRARVGAAVLAASLASFLVSSAPLLACQKCQFVEQGFKCAFSTVSCCAVINGSSCESGPCSGGCGALVWSEADAGLTLVPVAERCAAPAAPETAPAAEGKRARSVVLPARR